MGLNFKALGISFYDHPEVLHRGVPLQYMSVTDLMLDKLVANPNNSQTSFFKKDFPWMQADSHRHSHRC